MFPHYLLADLLQDGGLKLHGFEECPHHTALLSCLQLTELPQCYVIPCGENQGSATLRAQLNGPRREAVRECGEGSHSSSRHRAQLTCVGQMGPAEHSQEAAPGEGKLGHAQQFAEKREHGMGTGVLGRQLVLSPLGMRGWCFCSPSGDDTNIPLGLNRQERSFPPARPGSSTQDPHHSQAFGEIPM